MNPAYLKPINRFRTLRRLFTVLHSEGRVFNPLDGIPSGMFTQNEAHEIMERLHEAKSLRWGDTSTYVDANDLFLAVRGVGRRQSVYLSDESREILAAALPTPISRTINNLIAQSQIQNTTEQ